jgi:broad specificity phosphatase PhoE
MKIYILRHEERYDSPQFYTNLTPIGLSNSETLKYILEGENIDTIFSSPFPRVLQTIKPYCDMKNMSKLVNIDYSLYETMYDETYFKKDNYKIELLETDNEFYLANPNYKSLITIDDIKCPEIYTDVKSRTNNFLNYIINKYKNTNNNILITSHACAIHTIIDKYDKDNLYPPGRLTKIYDNNTACYIPINVRV